MYTVVRVTAPDEEVVATVEAEGEAVDRVRALEAVGLPPGVYHEVRDESRAVWTSEAGELVRLP